MHLLYYAIFVYLKKVIFVSHLKTFIILYHHLLLYDLPLKEKNVNVMDSTLFSVPNHSTW